MNRKAIQIFVIFTVLVVCAGALLARVQSNYKLGEPGVRLGEIPLFDTESNLVANVTVALPETALSCSSMASPVDPLELDMLPPDTVYGRRFYKDENGFNAAVSVVLMGTDRTSIHKPQYCLLGQGWQIEHAEVIGVPISQPHPYDLRVMKLSLTKEMIQKGGATQTVKGYFLYWFVADDQLTPYHPERMWWMARDLLTKGVLQRWAYVAYLSACYPGQEEALLEQMKRFVAETVPQFQIATGPRKDADPAGDAANSLALAEDF